MRYLVMSDLHGGSAEVAKCLEYFDKYHCNFIVLLGDLLNHGPRNRITDNYDPPKCIELLNNYSDKIISVRGNCDGEVDSMMFSFPCNAPYGNIIVQDPSYKVGSNERCKVQRIFLTHGHLHKIVGDALNSAEELRDKIGLKEGDIVLSGHTHVAGVFPKDNGLINVNPGSTTLPKGGTKAGFGLILEDRIEIHDLDDNLVDTYHFKFV